MYIFTAMGSAVLLAASLLATAKADAAQRFVWTGTGFTATYIEQVTTGSEQARNHLYVSQHGVRSELAQPAKTESPVAIVNFKQDSVWMVLPWTKSYTKVATYSAMFRESDAPKPNNKTRRQAGGNFIPMRVDRACQDEGTARPLGRISFDGRSLERWECGSARDPSVKVTRIYDPSLQLIVREEDRAGNYFELRDVQAMEPDAALFSVPADYRELSTQQLFQQPGAQLQQYRSRAH